MTPDLQPTTREEALAQAFHEAYERLAPSFGYETRKESAVAWAAVPEHNRKLMVAVCAEVMLPYLADLDQAEKERDEAREEADDALGVGAECMARMRAAEIQRDNARTRLTQAEEQRERAEAVLREWVQANHDNYAHTGTIEMCEWPTCMEARPILATGKSRAGNIAHIHANREEAQSRLGEEGSE